jgi:serine/threonine protein kinase/lipoprotein NlpI
LSVPISDLPCPSRETLRRSLDPEDAMSEDERRRIGAHVDGCVKCMNELEQLIRGNLVAPNPMPAPEGAALPLASRAGHWEDSALPAQFDRYTIRKRLGGGGMGTVYLAYDSRLDRPVALKFPRYGADTRFTDEQRFLREARAAATLSHPNLCPVYDVGRIDGTSYLAMAYIEGQSLADMLRDKPFLEIQESIDLARQLALAMEEAHRRGVIHRDLKPSNVMIDARGQPVVMDFGIARRGPGSGDVRLTESGAVMGSPPYMSPEQVNGIASAIGPASDVYSLGVIMYEMLTGRLPFVGPFGDLVAQIISKPPAPPSTYRPEIDASLEEICLKALAKKLAERFGSMQEFAKALDRCSQRTAPYIARESDASRPPPRPPLPSQDSEVRRLLQSARYHLEKRTEEGLRKSIAAYTQLLDKDPADATAWAGLAFAYHMLSVWGFASPTNACPKAKSAAQRALSLDEALSDAHNVLGTIVMEYDWDLTAAERDLRRSLDLDPKNPIAHQLLGKCLACQGRHDEAIATLRRAVELDPLSPQVAMSLGRHGFVLARRYDQAVQHFRRCLETDPDRWDTFRNLGWPYLHQGNFAEALPAFETAYRHSDDSITTAMLGHALAVSGQPSKARELLEKLTDSAQRGYVSPDCQAMVYIGLGDNERAFAWLEKSVEDRSEWLCKFRVDPVLDPLRSDPRFADLLRHVKVSSGDSRT